MDNNINVEKAEYYIFKIGEKDVYFYVHNPGKDKPRQKIVPITSITKVFSIKEEKVLTKQMSKKIWDYIIPKEARQDTKEKWTKIYSQFLQIY